MKQQHDPLSHFPTDTDVMYMPKNQAVKAWDRIAAPRIASNRNKGSDI